MSERSQDGGRHKQTCQLDGKFTVLLKAATATLENYFQKEIKTGNHRTTPKLHMSVYSKMNQTVTFSSRSGADVYCSLLAVRTCKKKSTGAQILAVTPELRLWGHVIAFYIKSSSSLKNKTEKK